MIRQDYTRRLTYIPGGGLQVAAGPWPVSGNWWEPTTGSFTCVAAYQAKGAASLAASYVNLANPGTNNAAPGSAPTFDTSYGWEFVNASGHYLTTGIIPANNQTWSVLVSSTNATNAAFWAFGASWGAGAAVAIYHRTSNAGIYNGSKYQQYTTSPSSAVWAFAGNNPYIDGTDLGTITTIEGTNTYGIYLGALNSTGSRFQEGNGRVHAIAIYSTTLNDTQVAEITTNMAAL